MKKTLKRIFYIFLVLCIPAGFFIEHEHAVFFWHKIPSVDSLFGFLGAMLLILGARLLAHLVQREEDFYD
jgi:hypothetical protein